MHLMQQFDAFMPEKEKDMHKILNSTLSIGNNINRSPPPTTIATCSTSHNFYNFLQLLSNMLIKFVLFSVNKQVVQHL